MKKFLASILVLAMTFVMSTTSFAATPSEFTNEETVAGSSNVIGEATYRVSNSGITLVDYEGDSDIVTLSTKSSVDGYNQKTVSGGYGTLYIRCSGSGTGGMGITIRTGCAYGDYRIHFHGYSTFGEASEISGDMNTNDTKEINDKWQSNLSEYVIDFSAYDDDGTPDFLVKVWIYG